MEQNSEDRRDSPRVVSLKSLRMPPETGASPRPVGIVAEGEQRLPEVTGAVVGLDIIFPPIGSCPSTAVTPHGGAIGTAVVLACVALLLRTAYEYLLLYPDVPWVQCFWSITYYNAWFMVVNDDPLVWFYYKWGFTTLPFVILGWWAAKWVDLRAASSRPCSGVA